MHISVYIKLWASNLNYRQILPQPKPRGIYIYGVKQFFLLIWTLDISGFFLKLGMYYWTDQMKMKCQFFNLNDNLYF